MEPSVALTWCSEVHMLCGSPKTLQFLAGFDNDSLLLATTN